MSSTMTVSQARAAFPDVLDRVVAGEEVTITRHGRPVAVIVRPDALRVRLVQDTQHMVERLRVATSTPIGSAAGISLQRADELVADMRAGRDR